MAKTPTERVRMYRQRIRDGVMPTQVDLPHSIAELLLDCKIITDEELADYNARSRIFNEWIKAQLKNLA